MDRRSFLKEAVVLLLAVVMVSSTLAVANTYKNQPTLSTSESGETSASPMNRAVVWDNGMGYKVGVLAAQLYPGDIDAFPADDFQFDATYEVNSVSWQGGYYNCQYASGGHDYYFPWNITFFNHNATGDKPGTVFKTFSFDNASITREFWYTTNSSKDWRANYSVTLSPAVQFLPDTQYWVTIYAYNATFPQTGWCRHNETVGGIKLHEGMFLSTTFGFLDWVNVSGLVGGVKQDFNYQLGGALVAAPVLQIETIKGPIGVTVGIKNTGDAKATNVNWNIALTGGLILLGGAKNGTIPEIDVAAVGTAKIPLVLGFGKTVISVDVTCAEGSSDSKSQNATVILIFVLPK